MTHTLDILRRPWGRLVGCCTCGWASTRRLLRSAVERDFRRHLAGVQWDNDDDWWVEW